CFAAMSNSSSTAFVWRSAWRRRCRNSGAQPERTLTACSSGPRLGTLAGHPRDDANVCLLGTRCATLLAVKYFAWDDAKNAKLRADRGIGFEDIVFHIERGDLLDV